MRKTALFILTLILISSFALWASADDSRVYGEYTAFVEDVELSEMENALRAAEENTGVSFRVYFSDGNPTVSEYRMLNELGMSDTDDLALLLIEYVGGVYYYELFLYGEADRVINYETSDSILDDPSLYAAIKSGRVREGALRFVRLTETAISDGRSSAKTRVIVISILISLLSGIAAVGGVYFSYKRKLKSPIYPLSKYARLSLDYHSDDFLGSSVTRTRINTSSGSGRSGGGGGGSRGRR